MPYTVVAKNMMLGFLRGAASHASLHSGAPTAANEIRGGAYERMKVDMSEPASGAMRLRGELVFSVPEGVTVTHVGFWTGPKAGVLLAHGQVEATSFSKRGLYILDGAKLDLNLG